jgi:hypothetical protein
VRAPSAPLLLLLLACPARAEAPEAAFEAVREGLLSPGRGARDTAERRAREIARTDPSGVAALWDGLDLPGRCHLVRALGAAGTRHAAEVAHARATAQEPEIFRALLDGLAEGGEAALFAAAPEGLSAERLRALEDLRLRYRVEAELVRLKSPSGPTGHYMGQFKRMKTLGPRVIPILLDILTDSASSLPGEGAAGPYRSVHPGMVAFDPQELRSMTAYGLSEVVERDDVVTIARLLKIYKGYRRAGDADLRFEREDLAPSIAYSLHDLGLTGPAELYIMELKRGPHRGWLDELDAMWNLGYACIRIGRHDEGVEYYKLFLENAPNKAVAAYNLACSFSMRAAEARDKRWRDIFKRNALDFLGEAIRDHNYGDWKWMEEDGDLSFIREEPEYRELLRHLQERYPERKKGKVLKGRSFLAPK